MCAFFQISITLLSLRFGKPQAHASSLRNEVSGEPKEDKKRPRKPRRSLWTVTYTWHLEKRPDPAHGYSALSSIRAARECAQPSTLSSALRNFFEIQFVSTLCTLYFPFFTLYPYRLFASFFLLSHVHLIALFLKVFLIEAFSPGQFYDLIRSVCGGAFVRL